MVLFLCRRNRSKPSFSLYYICVCGRDRKMTGGGGEGKRERRTHFVLADYCSRKEKLNALPSDPVSSRVWTGETSLVNSGFSAATVNSWFPSNVLFSERRHPAPHLLRDGEEEALQDHTGVRPRSQAEEQAGGDRGGDSNTVIEHISLKVKK